MTKRRNPDDTPRTVTRQEGDINQQNSVNLNSKTNPMPELKSLDAASSLLQRFSALKINDPSRRNQRNQSFAQRLAHEQQTASQRHGMFDNQIEKTSAASHGLRKTASNALISHEEQLRQREQAREAQAVSSVLDEVVARSGWKTSVSLGALFVNWSHFVGKANAEKSHVESFDQGILVVKCDSTAWASQLTVMAFDVQQKINEKFGYEAVKKIIFKGPAAPSWKKGVRHVPGRGPRDTYG